MKKLFNIMKLFLNKFLTSTNLSKIIVIFIVGLMSRYLINEYLSVNVFTEYLSMVSITFYSFFATFVVFVHESFSFFKINIIPNIIINMFNKVGIILRYILIEPLIYLYSITWGKYPNLLYINNSRNSRVTNSSYFNDNNYNQNNESYSPSETLRSESHYPNNYESDVSAAQAIQNGTPKNHNANSFYSRIAEDNPYINEEYLTNISRSALSNLNSIQIINDHGNKGSAPQSSSYSTHEDRNNDLNARYFYVDTINVNGFDRNLHTPNTIDPSVIHTPRISHLSTPSTRTPLFNSREALPRSSYDSSIFTNDTNHASVGYVRSNNPSPEPEPLNITLKRERGRLNNRIRERIHEEFYNVAAQPNFRNEEVTLYNNNLEGKAQLGVKLNNYTDKIHGLYIRYHDITKRKFFWNIWEKGKGNYSSYEEFKSNFNPKTNIWKEITATTKSDISGKVRSLLNTNTFGYRGRAVEVQDIRRLPNSSTQSRLNQMNSNRHKSRGLPHRPRR